MKLEMLPEDERQAVYAAVTLNNEVVWAYPNNDIKENPWEVDVAGFPAPFLVWRTGDIVHVEACGWYDPRFHLRLSLNRHEPYQVVILAHEMAGLMEQAKDMDLADA